MNVVLAIMLQILLTRYLVNLMHMVELVLMHSIVLVLYNMFIDDLDILLVEVLVHNFMMVLLFHIVMHYLVIF